MATSLYFTTNLVLDHKTSQWVVAASNLGAYLAAPAREGTVTNIARTSVAGPTAPIIPASSTNQQYWLSPPLSADITISGAITKNIRASESNMSANATWRILIERTDSDGSFISTIQDYTHGTELGTSETTYNTSAGSVTSTNMKKGDRFAISIWFDDATAVNMATGYTLTFYYSGSAGATGDSYITFSDTPAFTSYTPTTTYYLTNNAADADLSASTDLALDTTQPATSSTTTRAGTAGLFPPKWWTPQLTGVTIPAGSLIFLGHNMKNDWGTTDYNCPSYDVYKTNSTGGSPVLIASSTSPFAVSTFNRWHEWVAQVGASDVVLSDGDRIRVEAAVGSDARSGGTPGGAGTATFGYGWGASGYYSSVGFPVTLTPYSAPVTKTGSDAGVGNDAGTRGVGVYGTDAGVGADANAGGVSIKSAVNDTGVGADTSVNGIQISGSTDAGTGADTVASVGVYGTDAGVGADANAGGVSIKSAVNDTGVGADANAGGVSIASTEAGVGADAGAAVSEAHSGDFALTGGGVVTEVSRKGGQSGVAATGGGVVTVGQSTVRGAAVAATGGGVVTLSAEAFEFHSGAFAATGGGVATVGRTTARNAPVAATGGGVVTIGYEIAVEGEEHSGDFAVTGGGVVTVGAAGNRSGAFAATGGGVVTLDAEALEFHSGDFAATGGGAVTVDAAAGQRGSFAATGGGVVTVGAERWEPELHSGDFAATGGGVVTIGYEVAFPEQHSGDFAVSGGGVVTIGAVAFAAQDTGGKPKRRRRRDDDYYLDLQEYNRVMLELLITTL